MGRVSPFGASNSVIIRDSYTLGTIDIKTIRNAYFYVGSLIGYISSESENLNTVGRITGELAGNAALSGNYALSTMPIGIDPGAEVGSVATAVDTGIDGSSKTAEELSANAFWTGIGFSTDIWDFVGLNIVNKVYPRLKSQLGMTQH